MFKKKFFKKNQWGLTFIELMLVIAIMAMISVGYYVQITKDNTAELTEETEELILAVRQVRNLAISRASYTFTDGTTGYPVGGYGVYFNGQSNSSYYLIYADKGVENGYQPDQDDEMIGDQVFVDPFQLRDHISEKRKFFFNFVSQNEIATDMTLDGLNRYVARLRWKTDYPQEGYESHIRLGEQSDDGYVWSNVNVTYDVYTPDEPPGGGRGKDPATRDL